jgi:hypothetical protein
VTERNSEQAVSDAAQDSDDESLTRSGLDPTVIVFLKSGVFLESGVEDLVRRLDAPVAMSDEQLMVGGEAHTGHA